MGFWSRIMGTAIDFEKMRPKPPIYHWKPMKTKYKKEKHVNLSLLKRPKKIKAGTNTAFVYAPCELTVSSVIKPGEAINIIDVFEGNTPEETTLKVMRHADWTHHIKGSYQEGDEMQCTTREELYDRKNAPCHCHMEPDDMPESFREKIHYVLLTDVGK